MHSAPEGVLTFISAPTQLFDSLKKYSGLCQVYGVKALGEPAVYFCEQPVGFYWLTLLLEEMA